MKINIKLINLMGLPVEQAQVLNLHFKQHQRPLYHLGSVQCERLGEAYSTTIRATAVVVAGAVVVPAAVLVVAAAVEVGSLHTLRLESLKLVFQPIHTFLVNKL